MGSPKHVVPASEIALIGALGREMEYLAEAKAGEKIKRLGGPHPGYLRLPHCFGKRHAMNRRGELVTLQLIVGRSE
jgi:hypothetical protein